VIEAPVYFRARDLTTGFVQRGIISGSGLADLILPTGDLVIVDYLNPQDLTTATTVLFTPGVGQSGAAPRGVLAAAPGPDADLDNLTDEMEGIIGTDPNLADTDMDGISDGAEVVQGTNPLDGLVVQTGIVATADTPGTALDICAVNDMTIVADGLAGISVFNVFNGMNPTIIAQVDTPGDAGAVTCSGNLIAVADGQGGLVIIDVSDPPAAFILHQVSTVELGGIARGVTSAAGVAYVGTNFGEVVAVDLATGTVIDRISLGVQVDDLAIEGDVLQVGFNAGRHRVFVGGGIAYAVIRNGYNTIDVKDPANPFLIAVGSTTQISWKHIVANGSGLGVAAVSANSSGPHNVYLHDVSDSSQTDVFLVEFVTPGTARAVSIYNGLAYVADTGAGLQVINYLAYDAMEVPPGVSFTTSAGGAPVEEGSIILVDVDVQDDVQVRNVELLLDDVTVQTDGNFPFQFFFNAPLLPDSVASQDLSVSLIASDTGGNRMTALPETLQIIPDTFPPKIGDFSPAQGDSIPSQLLASIGINVRFTEPVDSSTVTMSSVSLTWAGPDSTFGTADDAPVAVELSVVDLSRRIVVSIPTVPFGPLRLTLDGSAITDLAGNLLDGDGDDVAGGDFVLTFRTFGSPFTKFWVSDVSGHWEVGSNWCR
jgi:hypothetical protein